MCSAHHLLAWLSAAAGSADGESSGRGHGRATREEEEDAAGRHGDRGTHARRDLASPWLREEHVAFFFLHERVDGQEVSTI
jgi:hypothetical protein